MATARASQTATLLGDGRVLIAGGAVYPSGGGLTSFASAELYDPRTGSFSATGSMAHARVYHTATLLPDGRVLIAGGENNDSNPWLSSAELYVPNTGNFAGTGSMSLGSVFGTATLLADGRVLVAGASYKDQPLALAELFR